VDYEKFTIKAQEALDAATKIAQKNDHSQVEVEHLLKALLEQEDGIVRPLIEKVGANPAALLQETDMLVAAAPKVYGEAAQLYFTPAAGKVVAKAEAEASSLKDEFVST